LDDGGHTQIISNGGEVFKEASEIISCLDKIIDNYEEYQQNIDLPTIDEVGEEYFKFIEMIYEKKSTKIYNSKKPNYWNLLHIKFYIFLWLIEEKAYALKIKVFK